MATIAKKKRAKPAKAAAKTAPKPRRAANAKPAGKPKTGFHKWTGHVPGLAPVELNPTEDNQAGARAALRRHFRVDILPAGSAVLKGCKIRATRKANPAAVRRMKVLGSYSKMLWEADGKRKPITSYGKEAATMARADGKI